MEFSSSAGTRPRLLGKALVPRGSRVYKWLILLVGICVAAGAVPAHATGAEGGQDSTPVPRIVVGEDAAGTAIPAEIVGANHRWPRGGLGMWDAEAGAPDPNMVDLSRRVGLSMVRYPGGTVANLFDWKKAIGPREERGCQVGGGFVGGAEPMDSVYGPDEHQQFVATVGARTQIMVPSIISSTADAADFVEYMNAPVGTNPNGGTAWAEVRAANGHAEPYAIRYWEIGNEPYFPNQRYWRSGDYRTALQQYTFGGTQPQVDQPVGTECDHRSSASISDGSANQSFRVHYPPVVPGSQVVYVDGEAWTRVDELAAAGPADTVYEFDPSTGSIRFGDGVHGQRPPAEAAITADYESGPHPGFVDYYAALKEVDSEIQVCSGWGRPEFVDLVGADHPYDCLGVHKYANPDKRGAPSELYDQLMVRAGGIENNIVEILDTIRANRPEENRPHFGMSEYGHLGAGPGDGFEGWGASLMSGVYMADLMATFVEYDAEFAEVSNLNAPAPGNVSNLFGGPPFLYTTRAHVLGLFSRLAGSERVVTAVERNPAAAGEAAYPALRVVSTKDADGVTRVMVVNKDRERAHEAIVQLSGERRRATVDTSLVHAPEFTAFNSAESPDEVTTSHSQSEVAGPVFSRVFPPHSVTLLEIQPN